MTSMSTVSIMAIPVTTMLINQMAVLLATVISMMQIVVVMITMMVGLRFGEVNVFAIHLIDMANGI